MPLKSSAVGISPGQVTQVRLYIRYWHRILGLVVMWASVTYLPGDAAAQLSASASEKQAPIAADVTPFAAKLTREDRLALFARLSDSELRQLLLRELATSPATAGNASGQAVTAPEPSASARIRQNLGDILEHVEDLSIIPLFAVTRVAGGDDPVRLFSLLATFALALVAGALAEWLFRRHTRGARDKCEQGSGNRIARLLPRLLLDLLALAIFTLTAAGSFALIDYSLEQVGSDVSLVFGLTYVAALAMVRLVSALTRVLLAPDVSALRLLSLDDANARRLHNWVIVIATLIAFGFISCALMQFIGLVPPLYELLLIMVGFVVSAALIAMIWRNRGITAQLISRKDAGTASQAAQIFADIWHWLAIAYVIALYSYITLARLAGYELGLGVWVGSLLIVIAVPLADAVVHHGISYFFSAQRHPQAEGGQEHEYEAILQRAVRLFLIALAAITLASLWGIDFFSATETELGSKVMHTLFDVTLTLVVAYVGWELVKTAIDHRLALEQNPTETDGGDTEGSVAGVSRLRTLLPLLRRFLQITIAVMVTMIVLSSLGVNIGPLLAGAGVVGLAVGFGAQTLVRDIVSGMFFLLDDAFRLGEYVDIGSVKGRVEEIHVRSLVLRHHRGPLHTVPFGEIKRLTNFSRDWVIMKFEFRVPYDTDINKVKKLFKQIGADLLAHERFGSSFVEPFKSQGVADMDDSAMIIRAKFKAIPEKQYEIRKEIYARVQKAFHDHGIKFAHRRVMVDLPPGIDANAAYGKAVADAAAAAVVADAPAKTP